MSPRVEAMHVADVSMAFCKLCKLLLRKTSATALPPTLGLWHWMWQDLCGITWGTVVGVLHILLSGNLFSAAEKKH